MKTKLILLAIASLFLFVSCDKDDPIEISLSNSEIDVPAKGGSYEIEINSTGQWYANYNKNYYTWCVVEGEYKTGNDIITIIVSENKTELPRIIELEISSHQVEYTSGGLGASVTGTGKESVTKKITINQAAGTTTAE